MDSREANWRAALWIGVALACAGPLIGFGGSLLGMQHSFTRIEKLRAPTPAQLQEGVRDTISYSLIGFGFGAAGVVLLLLALWRLSRLRGQRDAEAAELGPWR